MSVEVIGDEDETTEYYTDEELTNNEGTPKRTGINDSDIESFDRDESIDSTEEDLRNIREKETKKKEEEDDDDGNYTSNDEETKNDDENDDKSRNTEEVDSEEEGRNDTTESSTIDVLCCSGEFCEQEGGLASIGLSHGCIKCEERLHSYLCSNRNAEEMNGMT